MSLQKQLWQPKLQTFFWMDFWFWLDERSNICFHMLVGFLFKSIEIMFLVQHFKENYFPSTTRLVCSRSHDSWMMFFSMLLLVSRLRLSHQEDYRDSINVKRVTPTRCFPHTGTWPALFMRWIPYDIAINKVITV